MAIPSRSTICNLLRQVEPGIQRQFALLIFVLEAITCGTDSVVYLSESIMEINSDAQTFGLKSENSVAVSNSSLAISWLEAAFAELNQQKEINHISAVKAQPFVLIDASLSLQGPLRRVCGNEVEDPECHGVECDGRAVGLLYNSVGKDSILVTAWSGGQLQIDALADEIQPLWHSRNPPRIRFDSNHCILGFAMICESSPDQLSLDYNGWLGHPPPVLRLAVVDLALRTRKNANSLISMYIDPLIPERIYCLHDGGVDSIVLHFLPFTNPTSNNVEVMKTPSVHQVLSTCQGSNASSNFLCGFVVLADSFGYSWIAGVTCSRECIVIEMKTWNVLLPRLLDTEKQPDKSEETENRITPDIISRELLAGPEVVLAPQGSNMRSVTADSIEGRSTLHHYFKLFNGNYVEYAHKVYFELKHHGPHVKKIIDNMHTRLHEVQQNIHKVEEKQLKLVDRIKRATKRQESLEERLRQLRRLPGIHNKPLTRAECEFKAELDRFESVDLDAIHSSMEALNGRLRRYTQALKAKATNYQRTPTRKKTLAQDTQLDQLKVALVNLENTKKVKLIESALMNHQDVTVARSCP